MLDTLIRGGTVIDGTGTPARRADVGILDGRIVSVDTDVPAARETIDADELVVAPGFVDIHTHYDAQVLWDSGVTPSSLHGVTTIIGGNCGFTIAPVDRSSQDYVMEMLATVEGMPVESLRALLPWPWETFGEWLETLDGRVALNCGFLVGHSTIRRLVMGDDWRRAAQESEIFAMERLVDASLDAGALGFSSSWGDLHADHHGHPVPSRWAEPEELVRLATRLRGRPGTILEFIPSNEPFFPDLAIATMVDMAVAAGRPLNWNVLGVRPEMTPEVIARRLSASDRAAERGAKVVGLTMPLPLKLHINLLTTIAYNWIPVWASVFGLPPEERLIAFSDATTRARMAEAIRGIDRFPLDFGSMTVGSVGDQALEGLVGRTVDQLAAERGQSALDVVLDIAVQDRLRTCFETAPIGDDADSWKLRQELWHDPRVMIGASDAGAHLDMLATFGYFTDFVGPTVRDRQLLSLEEAVHLITEVPSRFYGLKDRGRLARGQFADVVVFDPASIATGEVVMRMDMPGDASRIYAAANGVERVFVNGIEIVTQGELTGSTPGTVLRGGQDTL